jgi:ferredoxin
MHRLRIEPSGQVVTVAPSQSLLEAALAAGINLPSSCRNGTCRRCLCQLERGAVRYRIEWPGVSVDEREQGLILPCVALPDALDGTPAELTIRLNPDA